MDYRLNDEEKAIVKKMVEIGKMPKEAAELYFPELADSEDEMIRKQIKAFIKSRGSQITQSKIDTWIAWLDKPVIPKFRVGDVIKESGNSTTYKVVRLIDNGIAFVDDKGEEYTKYYDEDDWDSYELVEQKTVEEIKGDNGGISPNLEWSEEDEKMLEQCCVAITDSYFNKIQKGQKLIDWLKSLKDRVQLKQEWSEEEIENCAREAEDNNCIILAKHIRQLKSLRPQNHWKPTEEQIYELTKAVDYYTSHGFPNKILNELLNQLKNL